MKKWLLWTLIVVAGLFVTCTGLVVLGTLVGSDEIVPAESTATAIATPAPFANWECTSQEFKAAIVKLSEDNDSPLAPTILKLYQDVEEIERTQRLLKCEGMARLNRGGDRVITYHVERDAEGDAFIGYKLSQSPVPQTTAAPTAALAPGMYQVGVDIEPGVYAGMASSGLFGSCYWERLSGASGAFDDILANGNADGQFYVEVLASDTYFRADCEVTSLSDWPTPTEPMESVPAGMYLVGRDIVPGTYKGTAGTDVLDSCYWARLSGLSGEFDDLVANDNANGGFFVEVSATDMALETGCELVKVE